MDDWRIAQEVIITPLAEVFLNDASLIVHLLNDALSKIAPSKLTFVKLVPRKMAPVKSAPLKFTLVRLAPEKFAFLAEEFSRSQFFKVDLWRRQSFKLLLINELLINEMHPKDEFIESFFNICWKSELFRFGRLDSIYTLKKSNLLKFILSKF